jgi:uncharacterized phosphosugar-binding protein
MLAYFDVVRQLLDEVQRKNAASFEQAAHIVAEALRQDGLLHVFGTGHSHLIAEEMFDRAGGLLPINPILDSALMLHVSALTSTDFERMHGYAEVLLKRYHLGPHDAMLVISNSGRNAVPVEMALAAKAHGLPVIAMTAVAASRAQPSRHSSGQRLCDVADVVLDMCTPLGDAVMSVEGVAAKVSSTSTVIGAALAQALVHRVVAKLAALGVTPPIHVSANLGTGADYVAGDHERFRARIRHL